MAPRLYNREPLIDDPYLLGLGVEDHHHGGDHGDLVVHVHQGLQTKWFYMANKMLHNVYILLIDTIASDALIITALNNYLPVPPKKDIMQA